MQRKRNFINLLRKCVFLESKFNFRPLPISLFLLKGIADLLDEQRQSDIDTSLADPTTSNTMLFDESPSTSENVEISETETFLTAMRSKLTQMSFKPAKVSLKSIKTQTIVDTASTFFPTAPV